MNDEQFQQWLAQHGGEVGRKNNEKTIDGSADPDTGLPSKRTTIDTTMITAKDGATITLRRQPGPINNGIDYEVVDTEPPKASATVRTPEQQRADAANATKAEKDAAEATRIANESSWNADPANRADGGSGRYEDHATRDARLAKEKTEADARSRQTKIDEQNAATAAAASRRADSAEARAIAEANRVGSKVEDIPLNGQHYTRITKTSADGTKTEIENYGPDGNRIAALPTEVKPGQMVTVDGEQWWAAPNIDPSQPPKLTRIQPGGNVQPKDDGPQFAPGMSSSEYLQIRRQYWLEQRKAGVPQKAINDGWDRDVQIANARQNERSTEATQQNQRLSSAMSGFGQAQSAVDSINKYLPEGSDLGGRAFEAMLALQRGQAQRMGGYGPMGNAAPLAVPPAPIGADPSAQVAAIPPAPAAPGVPTLASPEGQGMLATNEANRQLYEATHGAGAPPGAAPPTPPPTAPPTPTAPPAVQGEPSPLGDTGAPPVSMAPQGAPVAAIPESPYDFQARVANTVPWKLTEQDYQQAQAMGLGDQFWQTGRVA